MWRSVAAQLGEIEAARRCAALLEAEDPEDVRDTLDLIGMTDRVLDGGTWKPYWVRSWGARGLLYVWAEECAPAVVHGLSDQHWRPAEMCVKVSARRELGQAGPGIAALAGHELPRVRAAVARALGVVGDTEHVEVVRRLLDDPDSGVRAAAERALPRIADRLDIRPER
jgi:HEAT repeat protein